MGTWGVTKMERNQDESILGRYGRRLIHEREGAALITNPGGERKIHSSIKQQRSTMNFEKIITIERFV